MAGDTSHILTLTQAQAYTHASDTVAHKLRNRHAHSSNTGACTYADFPLAQCTAYLLPLLGAVINAADGAGSVAAASEAALADFALAISAHGPPPARRENAYTRMCVHT